MYTIFGNFRAELMESKQSIRTIEISSDFKKIFICQKQNRIKSAIFIKNREFNKNSKLSLIPNKLTGGN